MNQQKQKRGEENVPQEGFKVGLANVSRLLYRLKKESSITICSEPDHSLEVSLALKDGEAVNCAWQNELTIYKGEYKYWTDEKFSLTLYLEGDLDISKEEPIDPFTLEEHTYYRIGRENVDRLISKTCKFLRIPLPKTLFEKFCILTALFYSIEGLDECCAMLDYFGVDYIHMN